MSQFEFKMPDLGEGTVEAEIVAWRTAPGAVVVEDEVIVEVMTDKAAVEVPAPVSGRVLSISGGPGDKIAVGAPLIVFELAGGPAAAGAGGALSEAALPAARAAPPPPQPPPPPPPQSSPQPSGERQPSGRVKASPADRRRAQEAGVDLTRVAGSGPGGRVRTADVLAAAAVRAAPAEAAADTTEIKVIGVRRVIAERMSAAKRNIPHFSYVEEIDVTELDELRRHLNKQAAQPLSYLPLVVMAVARVVESFPQCNAVYDAGREMLIRHRAVHVGIATQTPDGLKVPVVRNAQAMSLSALAAAIRDSANRARDNRSTREELGGSTITVTSLGKLGGIASTPVINAPEVAIIGLNKAVARPVVRDGAIVVRVMMNLSSSFDHRFVDGYDAAAMIQALKDLLEHPTLIFLPKV